MKRIGKGKERELPTQKIKISNLSQEVHNNYNIGKGRKAPMRKIIFLTIALQSLEMMAQQCLQFQYYYINSSLQHMLYTTLKI